MKNSPAIITQATRIAGVFQILFAAGLILVSACSGPSGSGGWDGAAEVILIQSPGHSIKTEAEFRTVSPFIRAAEKPGNPAALTFAYPPEDAVFPPEFLPPTLLWQDSSQADTWLFDIKSGDSLRIYVLTASPPLPPPRIDSAAIPEDGKMPIPDPNIHRNWTPGPDVWNLIKTASVSSPAIIAAYGFRRTGKLRAVSYGKVSISTSKDSVGAPIFYRDVPLMPVRNPSGQIMPLDKATIKLVGLRLRDISKPDSRLVLRSMYTCSNCHSFSDDGRTMGMDIDGPQSDKGSYGVVPVSAQTVFNKENMISWNYDFKDKPADKKTIGFLSRVSPDGKYVATTVNEEVYVVNYLDIDFIQVFYPTRGVLAYYHRESGDIKTIPGADDTAYVHCDPVWTPDGKEIIFARAPAKASQLPGQEKPARANAPEETKMRYSLYRMPFNGGAGGKAVPVAGASDNGMSNNFPKVTPDGRFIVFVKCRNGQLMRPDSRLWIVPARGGEAREMKCNTSRMNSWHSFSPNGRWMVFSSKANSVYTQLFLTHLDENGNDTPPIFLPNSTAANRAVNIPEFVNIGYDDLLNIEMPAVKNMLFIQNTHALLRENKPEAAKRELRAALKEEKEDKKYCAEVLVLLAILEQNPDSAIARLREAIATDPDYHLAYFNLGILTEQKGDISKAVSLYKKALSLDPGNTSHMARLANAYMIPDRSGIRRIRQAVETAYQAAEKTYFTDPSILTILARAYSEDGRFKNAVETAQSALALARKQGQDQSIYNLQVELGYYKMQKPFSDLQKRLSPRNPG